jgi:hypothetical protein
VFREDDFGDEMYSCGRDRSASTRSSGKDRLLIEMVEPGGYFGEMAIIDDLPRTATATAEVDTSLSSAQERFPDRGAGLP